MRHLRFSAAWAVWLTAFVTSCCFLVAPGCGGGNSSYSAGYSGNGGKVVATGALLAKGKVTLPAGFKLPLAQLQVLSDSGQADIGADGSLSAAVVSTGTHMVQLMDKVSGKAVLLGYVDAGTSGTSYANGAGVVSAASTADALIFCGLLGPGLPTSEWDNFQTSIIGTPLEARVADVVTSSDLTNPTAIADGDTAIQNAVAAVQGTYVGPSLARSPSAPSLPRTKPAQTKPGVAMQQVVVRRHSVTGALIEVQPVKPQASLVIQPNPNGDGIVPVSTSRRRGAIFVYKVGTGPDTKHITPINPPQDVFADIEIEPTEEIGSVYRGVFNGLLGKFAYVDLTNPPILIQPDPVQEIAVYDVVAIGPGSIDTIPIVEKAVAPNSIASQAEYDIEWRKAFRSAQLKVLFKDVIVPLLIELVLSNTEASEAKVDDVLESSVETVAETAPGVVEALNAFDLKGAGKAFLTAIEGNLNGVKTKMIATLAQKFVSTQKKENVQVFQDTVSTALGSATALLALIGVVNKGIAIADVTQAFHDNTTYENANMWVADVLQPVVSIVPQKSLVDTNDPLVHLQVEIQNVSDLSTFRFQWTCTNHEGGLQGSSSTAALGTGITAEAKPVYVTDFTNFAVGTVDTVTVTVYDENDLNSPLGTGSATITGAPAPCATPAPGPLMVGTLTPTITLSEPATRPGDTFTVKVAWPADPRRDGFVEVTLFSAAGDFTAEQNPHESAQLVSVDGVAAKSDSKDIYFTAFENVTTLPPNHYHVASASVAQTHTLTFLMKEPTDTVGNPSPYCSTSAGTSGGATYPYVLATGFSAAAGGYVDSTTYEYFNQNP